MNKVGTGDIPTNMMTKSILVVKFKHCLDLIGVCNYRSLFAGFGEGWQQEDCSMVVEFVGIQVKVEICRVCLELCIFRPDESLDRLDENCYGGKLSSQYSPSGRYLKTVYMVGHANDRRCRIRILRKT